MRVGGELLVKLFKSNYRDLLGVFENTKHETNNVTISYNTA